MRDIDKEIAVFSAQKELEAANADFCATQIEIAELDARVEEMKAAANLTPRKDYDLLRRAHYLEAQRKSLEERRRKAANRGVGAEQLFEALRRQNLN